MAATKDMTTGNPTRLLFSFSLPLMLGNIFQQLYTIVDTIIVGQGVGMQALASIGATDWLNWLFLWMAAGMTQGFSILFAQYYGGKNNRSLHKSIGNAVILTIIVAVMLTVMGELVAMPMLTLLKTPEDIVVDSLTYLQVMIGGLVVTMFYSLEASLLRAFGDGRSPLTAKVIVSCTNIGLDLLFVMGFHWGIAGAAAATLIAQGISCIYCFSVLCRIPFLQLKRQDFAIDISLAKRLLRLGMPIMFQDAIVGIGVMVQSVINGFGILFVAGFTATNKIYGVLEAAAISYGYAISTFVAQNKGAGNNKRIKVGMRKGATMAFVTSLMISAIMFLWGEDILSLFISAEEVQAEQIMQIAYHYLMVMSSFLAILYAQYIYSSALQGMGNTIIPMVSGIVEFAITVSAAIFLPKFIGQAGIFYAEVLAWSGACVPLITVYYKKLHLLTMK